MLDTFKGLIKKPQTIVGVVMALAFQVIFCLVWMTGYNGVNDRVKEFKIAVVNEDGKFGEALGKQLEGKLPFQVVSMSAADASEGLNNREVQMIVTVPQQFSADLKTPGKQAELKYTINESNPVTVKSAMQSAANSITASVNAGAAAQGTQAVLEQLKMPAEQAGATSSALTKRVDSEITFTNKIDGMNNQMVPMMLVLASFVGAMIMGMNVQQGVMMMKPGTSKWQLFGARMLLNVLSAVFVSLVGSSLVMALGGQAAHGFLSLWMFLGLFVLTFMLFAQMFLILFGMAGMLVNVTMLSLQLVSSGAMVPRQLLSDAYQSIGEFLPASYAVEGLMNLQFGGPAIGSEVVALLLISLISIGISLLRVSLKREPKPDKNTELSTDPVATAV
ncbi:ABC-2 family transporter protein [compost metagenome]